MKEQKERYQARITGTVKLKKNCIKVNNLSITEFLETVAALECKTR